MDHHDVVDMFEERYERAAEKFARAELDRLISEVAARHPSRGNAAYLQQLRKDRAMM